MSLTATAQEKPVATAPNCIHCGTPFRPTPQRPDFCCAGCQFVHDLIKKNGLGQFYDLQQGELQPVKSLVFQKRDYTWLDELVKLAESAGAPASALRLDLQGISCIGCVWLIEKLFERKPGALTIEIDPAAGGLELRWKTGALDVVQFARELQSFGYLVGSPGGKPEPAGGSLIMRLGLCGALALNAMLFTLPAYLGMEPDFEFAGLFSKLTLLFGTLSLVIGGSYFFSRTWQSLRNRVLHVDLPISVGLLAAYAGSVYAWLHHASDFVYFDFVSIFVFLMLVGRWLQQKAVERNRNQLLGAQSTLPPVIAIATGEKVAVADLAPGLGYAVAPGQAVPVRSKLLSEGATLGLEWINGESEAQTAPRGRVVSSGALNYGQSPIKLEALEPWDGSVLSSLLRISPRTHRNAVLERFIRAYIFVVVALALGGFGAWYFAKGELLPALQVLISVLVVSCPCAAGVALPLADEMAASRLRKLGVFLREHTLWSRLDRVRKILFDKTGTLTLETSAIRNPEALQNLTLDQKSVLLAMVADNLHPASCCLREQLLAAGIAPAATARGEETVGYGLELRTDEGVWRLGRPAWTVAGARQCDREPLEAGADCVFSFNGYTLASFSFGEEVRADAVEEIAALRGRGCAVFILSGDRREKVEAMADRLGLPRDSCQAGMSPQGKADWVRRIDEEDTLMIGDGANDSLAFDHSYCTGTPAIDRGLLEQKADFYFLGRGLAGVRQLLDIARSRRRVVRRVVKFAIGYNVTAIALCLAGSMNPLAAAILMPVSSLVSLGIVAWGGR